MYAKLSSWPSPFVCSVIYIHTHSHNISSYMYLLRRVKLTCTSMYYTLEIRTSNSCPVFYNTVLLIVWRDSEIVLGPLQTHAHTYTHNNMTIVELTIIPIIHTSLLWIHGRQEHKRCCSVFKATSYLHSPAVCLPSACMHTYTLLQLRIIKSLELTSVYMFVLCMRSISNAHYNRIYITLRNGADQ